MNMVLHIKLVPEKCNDINFQKLKKKTHTHNCGAIFGPFYLKLDQWKFA